MEIVISGFRNKDVIQGTLILEACDVPQKVTKEYEDAVKKEIEEFADGEFGEGEYEISYLAKEHPLGGRVFIYNSKEGEVGPGCLEVPVKITRKRKD